MQPKFGQKIFATFGYNHKIEPPKKIKHCFLQSDEAETCNVGNYVQNLFCGIAESVLGNRRICSLVSRNHSVPLKEREDREEKG